jgi:undecaprenyl-diphosphatase
VLPRSNWIRLARREVLGLAGLAVAAGATYAFVELADMVREGESHALDEALLLLFRHPTEPSRLRGPSWVREVAVDLSSLGGPTVLTLISLSVVVFLLAVRKRGAALLLSLSVGGGVLLSALLKLGFNRPRPDLVPHEVQVYSAAFPSGHAMLSAVTYLTLGSLLARVQPGWRVKAYLIVVPLLLTLLVGVSRVYLGVHWPTDVLAGWCLGAAWALLCWSGALWLQRRGKVEADRQEPCDAS